jgi:hypothetical protein
MAVQNKNNNQLKYKTPTEYYNSMIQTLNQQRQAQLGTLKSQYQNAVSQNNLGYSSTVKDYGLQQTDINNRFNTNQTDINNAFTTNQGDINKNFLTNQTNALDAHKKTEEKLYDNRYDQTNELELSAQQRGIGYSPQSLGLENVVNVSTNKGLVENNTIKDKYIGEITTDRDDKLSKITSERDRNLQEITSERDRNLLDITNRINELKAKKQLDDKAMLDDYNAGVNDMTSEYNNQINEMELAKMESVLGGSGGSGGYSKGYSSGYGGYSSNYKPYGKSGGYSSGGSSTLPAINKSSMYAGKNYKEGNYSTGAVKQAESDFASKMSYVYNANKGKDRKSQIDAWNKVWNEEYKNAVAMGAPKAFLTNMLNQRQRTTDIINEKTGYKGYEGGYKGSALDLDKYGKTQTGLKKVDNMYNVLPKPKPKAKPKPTTAKSNPKPKPSAVKKDIKKTTPKPKPKSSKATEKKIVSKNNKKAPAKKPTLGGALKSVGKNIGKTIKGWFK